MKEVKTIWYKCEEKLPETPKSFLDVKYYLTLSESGVYSILHWFDGWNCSGDKKDYEIKDIVAWAEIPTMEGEENG